MKQFLDNLVRYIEPYIVYPDIISTVVDILLLTVIVYFIIKFLIKTTAGRVIRGMVLLFVLTGVTEFCGLTTINWLLESLLSAGLVALIVIFQPEIRRALEKFGHYSWLSVRHTLDTSNAAQITNAISQHCERMSSIKCGSLIVIEGRTRVSSENGIPMDAKISGELLDNIFTVNTPLHDGAVVIRNGRIAEAKSQLPQSNSSAIPSELGMRHRAAIGVTEACDCFSIVVSEETGKISFAEGGTLVRDLDPKKLKSKLLEVLRDREMISKEQAKTLAKSDSEEKEGN
ncbi:MAG: TIGR00159 family protein [Clostridiales bacterium]|nr:TIGR00159 family protein [Clostridiales bacterium]